MASHFLFYSNGSYLETYLSVPIQEPVTLVLNILLNLTAHSTTVGLTTAGIDVVGHGLAGILLTQGITHEIIEACSLERQLECLFVEYEAVDIVLLDRSQLLFGEQRVGGQPVELVERCPTRSTCVQSHRVNVTNGSSSGEVVNCEKTIA